MSPLHSGIKRRHFLKALATVAVAAALPVVAPATQPALVFHRDAFAAVCPELGLGVRFIKAYVVTPDAAPCRLDILYGLRDQSVVSWRVVG